MFILLSENRNEIQQFMEDNSKAKFEDSIIKGEIPDTISVIVQGETKGSGLLCLTDSKLSMENINFESILPLSEKSKSETNLLLDSKPKLNKSLSGSSINDILSPEKCLLSINSQHAISGNDACSHRENLTIDNAILMPSQEMEQGLENLKEEDNLVQSANANSTCANSEEYDNHEPENLEHKIENIDTEIDSTKHLDK